MNEEGRHCVGSDGPRFFWREREWSVGRLVEERFAGPHPEVHLLLLGGILVQLGGLLLLANVLLLEAKLFVLLVGLFVANEKAIAIDRIGEPIMHPTVVGIEADLERSHALKGGLLGGRAGGLHVEAGSREHRLDALRALHRSFLRRASQGCQEGEGGEGRDGELVSE
jgi:hypothetical protein